MTHSFIWYIVSYTCQTAKARG